MKLDGAAVTVPERFRYNCSCCFPERDCFLARQSICCHTHARMLSAAFAHGACDTATAAHTSIRVLALADVQQSLVQLTVTEHAVTFNARVSHRRLAARHHAAYALHA